MNISELQEWTCASYCRPSYDGVTPKKLVIMLHGYGSNGANLIDVAKEMVHIASLNDVQFISPNAPFKFEGGNFGDSYQWFSLYTHNEAFMLNGMRQVYPLLASFVKSQLMSLSLSYEDLALLGFSQGGMLALHTSFRLPEAPSCVISYSGAMISQNVFEREVNMSRIAKTSVLLCHGENDSVVPCAASRMSYDFLHKLGVKIKIYLEKNLGHSISKLGLECGGKFLSSNLLAKNSL